MRVLKRGKSETSALQVARKKASTVRKERGDSEGEQASYCPLFALENGKRGNIFPMDARPSVRIFIPPPFNPKKKETEGGGI